MSFEIVAFGMQKGKVVAECDDLFREGRVGNEELVNAEFVFTDLDVQCVDSFLRSDSARFGEKSGSFESSRSLSFVGTALNCIGISWSVGRGIRNGTIAVYGSRINRKRRGEHNVRSSNIRRGQRNQEARAKGRAN